MTGGTGRDLVTQLFKVVLEDINDFIGLQLALNSRRHSIDESIQAFPQLSVIFKRLSCLSVEVLRVIRCRGINASIVVSLSLNVDHGIGCLQADFKFSASERVHRLCLVYILQIVGALTRIFINKLTRSVITKLTTLHRHSILDQRSISCKQCTAVRYQQLNSKIFLPYCSSSVTKSCAIFKLHFIIFMHCINLLLTLNS